MKVQVVTNVNTINGIDVSVWSVINAHDNEDIWAEGDEITGAIDDLELADNNDAIQLFDVLRELKRALPPNVVRISVLDNRGDGVNWSRS